MDTPAAEQQRRLAPPLHLPPPLALLADAQPPIAARGQRALRRFSFPFGPSALAPEKKGGGEGRGNEKKKEKERLTKISRGLFIEDASNKK